MDKMRNIIAAACRQSSYIGSIHQITPTTVTRPVICLQHIQIRQAGHSQWANRRHGKAIEDAKKAKVTAKITMMIRLAIRDSGPNPKSNHQLAKALELGTKNNVPSKSLQQFVEKAITMKDRLKQAKIEVRGPGGWFLIFDLFTENANRTKKDITRILLRTCGGDVMTEGGTRAYFQDKAIITVCAKDDSSLDLEDVEEVAIEVDAEEVKSVQQEEGDEESKKCFELVCEPASMYNVMKNLTNTNLDVLEYNMTMIPDALVDLSREEKEKIDEAIHLVKSLIEPSVTVEQVYDNINW